MIGPPPGVRVWLACGRTDMRKGMDGLAMLAEQVLNEDPFGGAVFAFRGRRGGIVKLLWYDGQGVCLYTKRLERGNFVWPVTETGRVSLTPAQLSMLLEGIDWRMARRGSFSARRRKGGADWARRIAVEALNPIKFGQVGVGALSPSARHCCGQAIGRSMRRLTPKPRGRRPSIAALTMGGATKASDSVMRIERSVLPSRVASNSMV